MGRKEVKAQVDLKFLNGFYSIYDGIFTVWPQLG